MTLTPQVGSRIYVVITEKCVVVPALVVERLTRETSDGTSSSYILDFGVENKRAVPSESITSADSYAASPQDAYAMLMASMTSRIERAVASAVEQGNLRFGASGTVQVPEQRQPRQQKSRKQHDSKGVEAPVRDDDVRVTPDESSL